MRSRNADSRRSTDFVFFFPLSASSLICLRFFFSFFFLNFIYIYVVREEFTIFALKTVSY